ncbi:MAG: GTPase Era, partial [Deltaproteobacteria bacterium]|nr:GTPase Era [Deltaproteobacteria bacterium]
KIDGCQGVFCHAGEGQHLDPGLRQGDNWPPFRLEIFVLKLNRMTKTCGTIALIGLPNAGKSTLLNALVGQKLAPVTYKPNTTRRILNGVVTRGDAQFVFVDTPGMTQRGSVPSADIVLWIADAKKTPQKPPIKLPANFYLVLNQVDRFSNKAEVLPVIQAWNELLQPTQIMPISARTGEGLEALLEALGKDLPKQAFWFDPDAITDASERELVAELIREKALLSLQSEVPYQLEVRIESFDESRREDAKKSLVDISANLEVARDSHKSIVIGKGGSMLKKIGQLARRELEALLGCQVMLRLFVKVKKR